jgi:DNA topoisomerase-3
MKTIVLAEKPSVGRELARVLKCNQTRNGYIEGAAYIVTWALGHLVTLADPKNYDKAWGRWELGYLPMLPEKMKLSIIRQSAKQFTTVKKLLTRDDVNLLIIATDAGREGELVARWIMEKSRWRKPFKRLWISSQTDAAIKEGFANLKPGRQYDRLYHAAVCRAEADWIIGLNVSRAMTCKFDAHLNAGRVQTPTLSMIVKREEEIEQFVPREFFTIKADFGSFTATWQDAGGNSRFFDKAKAQALINRLQGKAATVADVKSSDHSQQPPLAYDLTELQREANKRYGLSAKRTLQTVQSLYERHKVVTYPRTDSRYITTDMVPTLPARLAHLNYAPYAPFTAAIQKNGIHAGKRLVNDARVSDHHALLPTEQQARTNTFTTEEKQIYDLIVRRFLAVLSQPHKTRKTKVVITIDGEHFTANGKTILQPGWQAVERPHVDEEDDSQALPPLRKNATLTTKNLILHRGTTTPPARYTEATLLTAMESPGKFIEDEELRESIKAGGLGTPATRADIIEKLFRACYIERNGKSLSPTSQGRELIRLVPPMLKSPELTASWEKRLSDIASGSEQPGSFIDEIKGEAVRVINLIKGSTETFEVHNLTKEKCPLCGSPMFAVGTNKGKKFVCSDRHCRHESTGEPQEGLRTRRKSKKEFHAEKRLVAQYGKSDKKQEETLGDLFDF